jgi:DNA-binding GntR family transcriptional regulator
MPEKKSLKQQAYDEIKRKIVTCEYAPNTLLNEELLREELHVSRTPIRDALSRLEQKGLITILPKKGIMVSSLSINDINMVFEVRMMYEPYALLHYGSRIPYSVLTHSYELLSDLDAMSEDWAFFQADDAFHAAVVQAIGNRFLLQTYEWIQDQNLRFRVMTGQTSAPRLEDTSKEHTRILEACLKKDWSEAASAMKDHLINSKNATFDLLFQKKDTRL